MTKLERFAISLAVVLLLGVVVVSVRGTAQDGRPLVKNATSAIHVVSVVPSSIGNIPIFKISLQNVSSKTIKAYIISGGNAAVTRSYYLSETDTGLFPNGIDSQTISFNNGGSFTITGVIFEDGSTEGEAVSTSRLKESLAGLRDFGRLVLPCLRQLPATFVKGDDATVGDCENEAKVKAMPKKKSSDYEEGFQTAQKLALSRLMEIKIEIYSGEFSQAATRRDKLVKGFESVQRR